MPRDFRAVTLSNLRPGRGPVSVQADTVFDALQQARQFLGQTTPFDLLEGKCFVLAYRPPRRWSTIQGEAAPR